VNSAPTQRWAAIAACGSAACWGGATVLTKSALEAVPPLTLLVAQLGASLAVLWVAVALSGAVPRLDRHNLRAASSGLLEPGFAYTVGVLGLSMTTASNAALLSSLEPLFILAFAWLLFGEHVSVRLMLLGGIATLGVSLVMGFTPTTTLTGAGPGDWRGDLLIITGTAFAALYVIATGRLVGTVSPLVLTALQQSVGFAWAVFALAVALSAGWEAVKAVPWQGWGLAVLSGVIQYALAFWLYLKALQRLPARIAGFYLTLTPVFGVAAATLFLGEVMSDSQLIGSVLIVGVLWQLPTPSTASN